MPRATRPSHGSQNNLRCADQYREVRHLMAFIVDRSLIYHRTANFAQILLVLPLTLSTLSKPAFLLLSLLLFAVRESVVPIDCEAD